MNRLVECVPNFSEGRRPETVQAIIDAIQRAAPVHVLDYSSDADHNRSVVTFVGAPEHVEAAAFAAIEKASHLIDLNEHQGEHPRIGATDVCPFVPLRGVSLDDCVQIARRVGQRVGEELGIPVYFYEAAAARPDRVNLEDIRRGEFEGLREVIQTDPDRKPDFGPAALGSAGATVIGARPFLIAFNVYLDTDDVEVAKKIARAIRHSGGGMRYLKALGLLVEGRAQVSMNFTNFEKTPLHRVVELIRREAGRYGARVVDSELVGMIPQAALVESAQWYLQLDNLKPEQIIENRLTELLSDAAARAAAEETVRILPSGARRAPESPLRPEGFIQAVAEGTATPGGGAVAALCGALSAALAAMVARVTVGKRRYAEVEDEMRQVAERADQLTAALTDAIAEDVEAFNLVMAAYKIDKEDPKRAEQIQAAYMRAANAPLHVARLALDCLQLAETVAEKGNVNASSDAGVAAQVGLAAVEGATLNVLVNVKEFANAHLAGQVRGEVVAVRDRARVAYRRVMATLEARAELK
ncbi:MAG: glutamate formimidoyltransferase [Anaerolineae bacterium]|nr:glutamate formimidoyltransferase [Anaerolineae bacterium]